MGMDKLYALYWDFWHIPYFKVFVYAGNEVIKVFNQKIMSDKKGENIALMDWQNGKAWWANENCVIQKCRIIYHCNIKNAVPMKIVTETKTEELANGLINKITTKKSVKVDLEELNRRNKELKGKILEVLSPEEQKLLENTLPTIDGMPLEIKKEYPTDVFFDVMKGHHVHLTMSIPKSPFEELKGVLIAGLVVVAFIFYMYLNHGKVF